MVTPLARTPLYDWHAAHGGRLVDFAGWEMPVQYGSIIEEHLATRTAVGVFDVSHMGRLVINGPDAAEALDRVLTRRITDLKPGQIRYSLVCNESGGVLDDVLVYRIELEDGLRGGSGRLSGFGMVVNASNREKIVAWFAQQFAGHDVAVEDITAEYAMFAVQGPRAIELLDPLTDSRLTRLRYYTGAEATLDGLACYISRTGYTGEDGCEVVVHRESVVQAWECVMDAVAEAGGKAVGLAARDTLRLEAGMPLYGHELSEQINPIQAGLGFAVNLQGRDFIGRGAIESATRGGRLAVRVGLQVEGRRAPREGYRVLQGAEEVGLVTSGTFSPTLGQPIAMAYVRESASSVGDRLAVDIRGAETQATVVPLPFYERGS